MGHLKRKPDGLGKSKTYLGKVPVPIKRAGNLDDVENVDKMAAIVKLKPKYINFLQAYAKTGSLQDAVRIALPKTKAQCLHTYAWRWMKAIDALLTPEEKYTVMGLTPGKLVRVVNEAMDAKFQKEFVTKSGLIVAGADHEDHQIRLDAAKLGAKILGIDKENRAPAIAINVVQYAPPGAEPWPTWSSNPEVIDVTPEEEI
jgi:hypothetical protein